MPSLRADLDAAVEGEVRFDAGSRAAYSTDASNYRLVPIGVVTPKSVDDAAAAVAVCRDHDAPVLSRGGGTSLAGQCCNEAVVLDWSKFCDRVISVDPEHRTAIVEPGIVLDELNAHLADFRLMVGPRPSTHAACTIGGMLGNNSCGATAQAYGRMVDAVRRLEILTYDGIRMWVGPTSDAELREAIAAGGRRGEIYARLRQLRDDNLALLRTGFPQLPRRISGYNLDQLLPEYDFNLARLLVGSESTLATVVRAEIDLVPVPSERVLVVLGYEDIAAAADAVPMVAAHDPVALEGIDDRLIELERDKHLADEALDRLPVGSGWLMAQFAGDDADEIHGRADRLVADVSSRPDAPTVAFIDDPAREDELWEAREAGLAATAFPARGSETHEGWEDAAVPPERLGDYLRDFQELLRKFDYDSAALYGHFGHGCVHTRIPFDLRTAAGIASYRDFVERGADLVVSYGGSLSGEHGDGQSRGELLPRMFGSEIVGLFDQVKDIFDPGGRMNPGKVVRPRRLDESLREGVDHQPAEPAVHFSYPEDGHRFSHAANRCVGVGKCREHSGGVMCPSYRVTREERHSTRGRARLLFEMLQGDVIDDGWRSTEVRDALDLCLACKGCRSDCPVDVDMATYKAEFLAHHYRGRLRPLSHYSMGWLPLWARIASTVPGTVNALSHAPGLDRVVKRAGGIAQQRELPRFASTRFVDWFRRRDAPRSDGRTPVVVWPDTFGNNFEPAVLVAAVAVLEDAGFAVDLPSAVGCCGLTWISTGQLGVARRVLRRTLRLLEPELRRGTPIVVLEPSCAATLRSDLPELLDGDEDAHRLAGQVHTLAELLSASITSWEPPKVGGEALVRVHCHHHAIVGFDADRGLFDDCDVDLTVLDEGCCGLAGNFGFERGHYDVSMACAEDGTLPEIRAADPATPVVADGFSCRTQLRHSEPSLSPIHSAQLVAAAVQRRDPL